MISILRRIGTYVLVAVIGIHAYQAFRFWMAERIVEASPTDAGYKEALQWNPQSDLYYYVLGVSCRDSLESHDLETAIGYLKKAVELKPRIWTYHMELAVAYELNGDGEAAEIAFRRALRLNPRNALLRWQVANFYLRRQQTAEAMGEFREAVKLDPSRLNSAADRLAASGVSEDEIVQKLVPPRRDDLLNLLYFCLDQLKSEPPQALSLARKVWKRWEDAPAEKLLEPSKVYRYLDYLLQHDDLEQAKRVWRTALRESGRNDPGLESGDEKIVYDGGFEIGLVKGGLSWTFENQPDVEYEYDHHERFRGLASLRIDFSDRANLDFGGLRQRLVLPAGLLQLSFVVRARNITSDKGIHLEIRSLHDGALLAQSPAILGTRPWSRVTIPFETARPAAAYLVARRYPSRKFDNLLGGSLWLDDVQLSRSTSR